MKAGFLEKLIERLGRIGPEDVQNYFLRLAQEKGFLETVFNAIQEGIIVTDSKGRITYLNNAACGLFGLEAGEAIGKRLEERIGGLDWESLTRSGGPVSHDMSHDFPGRVRAGRVLASNQGGTAYKNNRHQTPKESLTHLR